MKYPDRFVAVDPEDREWTQSKTDKGPKGIHYKTIFTGRTGEGGMPDVHLSRYDPHWVEPRHRHVEDEVLILTAGEIEVEGTTYSAPAAIFVGRHTLYGPLTAGAEGAEFYRVAFNEKLIALKDEAADA